MIPSIKSKNHLILEETEKTENDKPKTNQQIVVDQTNSITSRIFSCFNDYFIDGKDPWKQKKYRLGMTCVLDNVNKDNLNPKEKKIIGFLSKKQKSPRDQYFGFLGALRNALKSQPKKNLCSEICWAHFAEVKIHPFCDELVEMFLKTGMKKIDPSFKGDVFELPLEKQFKAVTLAPQAMKAPKIDLLVNRIRGGFNVFYDPHGMGNMPYVIFDMMLGSHKIRSLRMGTPTIQRDNYETMTWEGEAKVIPEFYQFLTACSIKKKKLLWISLQDDCIRLIGTESERNRALKKLENDFPDNFFMLVLANDSPFYYQTGQYENEEITASNFKSYFHIEMLYEQNSGFYIPKTFIDIKIISSLLDEVHHDLFGNKEILNRQERLDFIEIFYARLVLHSLKLLKVDLFCFCCKDSIDRAAKCNVILLKLLQILLGKENDQDYNRKLYVNVHAPALLVKKRAMNFRQERVLSALNRLDDPQIIERIRKRKETIDVQGDVTFL